MKTHSLRIRRFAKDDLLIDTKAAFVLYWMTAHRRTAWNHALDRAVDWASELHKPLLIVETLSVGDRWASDRHHTFVLQGMADNATACKRLGLRYYPFVESKPGGVADLLLALAARSCLVITDDFPLLGESNEATLIAIRTQSRLELVDSNGLLPLQATDQVFSTAHAFRRFLHRTLPDHLLDMPKKNPLARKHLPPLRGLPGEITRRWPPVHGRSSASPQKLLAAVSLDHQVGAVKMIGGSCAARKTLRQFLSKRLAGYLVDRNHPDADATSGLSPYLHFGHISTHQIFDELAKSEGWSPMKLAEKATGSREGWWGMSPAAEAFLDQLVTWREVGFNRCAHCDDCDQYDSLPDWAKRTLADHGADRREYVYSPEEFEEGVTHDPLWNAAQRQLVHEGRMHNYLRMLWGKKILEWTPDPREALQVMIHLNNKYALDGQDPNSYSGIFWVLGRYDRPWGPERPIFGKVRYMSSENTARKLRLRSYLAKYAPSKCACC